MKFFFMLFICSGALGANLETPRATSYVEHDASNIKEDEKRCCPCVWPGDSYVLSQDSVDISLWQRLRKDYPLWIPPVVGGCMLLGSLPAIGYVRTADRCKTTTEHLSLDCRRDVDSQSCLSAVLRNCGSNEGAYTTRLTEVVVFGGGAVAILLMLPVVWISAKHLIVQALNLPCCRSQREHFLELTERELAKYYGSEFTASDIDEAMHSAI